MGPFRPTKDGMALAENTLSWNRLSNIVYVEVPVGVGFSYSHDPKDYRTGDEVGLVWVCSVINRGKEKLGSPSGSDDDLSFIPFVTTTH